LVHDEPESHRKPGIQKGHVVASFAAPGLWACEVSRQGQEMIQAIARKIDQFMHSRAEQRDLNSLWGFSYWRRAVRTAGVMTLDAAAMFAAFMLLILLTRSEAESARLLSPEIGMIVVGVASVLFLAAGMYQRSWRFVSFADSVSMVITSSIGLFCGWIAVGYFWGLPAAGKYFVPFAVLHFCVATMAMQLMRACRRAVRSYRRRQQNALSISANDNVGKTALLIGGPEWSLAMLDMFGPNGSTAIKVVGVLLPSDDKTISQLAKVPVLGDIENFAQSVAFLTERDRKPDLAIVCDDGTNISVRDMARLNKLAKHLNVEIVKLSDPASQLLNRKPSIDKDHLQLADLLGRNERTIERSIIQRQISGQCVLVTGAGGTIGGELVMQLASFKPSRIVLLDHSEYQLYSIEMRLRETFPDLEIAVELCSIRDADDVNRVFERHMPSVVYHAAALKHVPMVEANPLGGIHTNIIGTRNIANAVTQYSVRAMVQVSTDKAVNPVGMMGATKRVGELYCQSLDLCGVDDVSAPRFMTVRFGNVLGSSGSIVPLFKRQLAEGRPLTVTHPDIERFFMTVGEAVQLILESSSRSLEDNTTRGNIFVLDMGDPVKIVDLARRMARMYGLEPDVDVPIEFVGLRPGEKLFEELFDTCEKRTESKMPNLFEACSRAIPLPVIGQAIDQLETAVKQGKQEEACRLTHYMVALPSSDIDISSFFRPGASQRGNHLQLVQGV
jgi:FlaA1/EpsC-like NDP-sugar epimerase